MSLAVLPHHALISAIIPNLSIITYFKTDRNQTFTVDGVTLSSV